MKNSNDTIGNRTRNLPACSVVPQPTASPLSPLENRALRRTFGPKREEVTGKWRKLHNEELNDLYCSPNIVRVIKSRIMRWVGHVACMGERRGVYRVLVEIPEGKRPLGRPKRRWEDNINPLKPELNPICYLLALLGTHHFLHVSRIRVKLLTFRLLMS